MWDAEQLANARLIIQVGQELGASPLDIQIALATAIQESQLYNLAGGMGSSVGLFQQINDWGTFGQRHDPRQAARMFFTGGGKGQPGLFDISGRSGMSLTQAAQSVQRSAYPDAYAQWETAAGQLAEKLGGSPTQGAQQGQEAPVSPTAAGVEAPEVSGVATPDMPDLSADLPAELDTDWIPQPWTLPSPDEFARAFPGGSLTGNTIRGRIVREAMQWIGTPYGWGQAPQAAVDCSGLVQQVFGSFGIALPRVSYQQAGAGQRISSNQLQPGDLVAWDNSARNNGADHIAIYIGGGEIIEAPRPGLFVRRRTLLPDEDYFGVSMSAFL